MSFLAYMVDGPRGIHSIFVSHSGLIHQLLFALTVIVTAFVVTVSIRQRGRCSSVALRLFVLSFFPLFLASLSAYLCFITISSLYQGGGIIDPRAFSSQLWQGSFSFYVGWGATLLCLFTTYAASRARKA